MTLYDFFFKRPALTFVLLIFSGLAFGALTLNIFRLVAANWVYISQYGLTALRDGGLEQSLELIVTGIISMFMYLVFKFSERTLVDRICVIRFKFKQK